MHTHRPVFRTLDRVEAEEVLARNHVGRIAFGFHNRLDIEPIHYVYANGVIFARTAPGSKVTILRHAPWVAFEVDEVDNLFEWQSVVVHGTVYMLDGDQSSVKRAAYRRAVRQLRTLVPNALADGDPTPTQTVIMLLRPDTISGRAARSTDATERRTDVPLTSHAS